MTLSRGARLCEQIIRAARPRKGGVRRVGRCYLASRLGCSTRTVSRYVRELREAGRIEVQRPPRQKVRDGWRTVGVNTYRLCAAHDLAPHLPKRQNRRSGRGDTGVTSTPYGVRDGGPEGPAAGSWAPSMFAPTDLLTPEQTSERSEHCRQLIRRPRRRTAA